jgi:hypothetical protein
MSNPAPDRHKDHSRQYNVRVPNALMNEFNSVCKARGVKPALMLRTLMQGFVDVAQDTVGQVPA